MTLEQLQTMMKRKGIPVSTLENQIRSSIGWGKLINRKFSRDVKVDDAEITRQVNETNAEMNSEQYLIAEIVSRLFSLVFFIRALPKRTFDFSRISKKKVAFICKKHIELPKINMPSTFINAFTESLPVPFIAATFGIDIAGYYLLMSRVVLGTSSIITTVVADAFHGRLARIAKDNKDYLFIFFKKTLILLIGIASLQFLSLVFFAPQLFSLVFGAKWEIAGTLAQLTAPWAFFVIIVGPLSRAVFVYDKQKTKLVNDIIILMLTLLAMGLAKYLTFSLEQTTAAFAIARVISYSFYFIVLWRFVKTPENVK